MINKKKKKAKVSLYKVLLIIGTTISIAVGLNELGIVDYVVKKWSNLFPEQFSSRTNSFKILILPFNRLQINEEQVTKIEEAIFIELNKTSKYENLNFQVIKDKRDIQIEKPEDLVKEGRKRGADFVICGQLIQNGNEIETIFNYSYINDELILPSLIIEDKSFLNLFINPNEKSYLSITTETEPIKMNSLSEIFNGVLKSNIESVIRLILFFNHYDDKNFKQAYDISKTIVFGNKVKKSVIFQYQIDCLNKISSYPETIDLYTKVINDTSLSIPLHELYVNRGVTYKKSGKIKEAYEDYNMALELKEEYGLAYLNRGILNLQERKLDSAIMDFDRAIQIDSLHGKAYYLKGVAELYSEELHNAITDIQYSIKLNYSKMDVYNALGVVYLKAKKVDSARISFNKSFEIEPGNKLIHLNIAQLNMFESKFKDAIINYNMYLKLDSNNAEIINARGYAYLKDRQFENAIQDFSHAIMLNKDYSFAYNNRALAKAYIGRLEEAKTDIVTAEKLMPDNPYLFKHKGLIFLIMGNEKEAILNLRKAAKMNDDIQNDVTEVILKKTLNYK